MTGPSAPRAGEMGNFRGPSPASGAPAATPPSSPGCGSRVSGTAFLVHLRKADVNPGLSGP